MHRAVCLAICLALTCLSLTACADPDAGSFDSALQILDPAPFDPTVAPAEYTFQYTVLTCPTPDPACAIQNMAQLSAAYAQHRNAIQRGEYVFDIPVVGLAATLAVATGNHFASTTIGGMAVASAGLLGARNYLSPTAKAGAYGAASAALQCGAAGAQRLASIRDGEHIGEIGTNLSNSIAAAATGDPNVAPAQTAQKALFDADGVLHGAPARLGFMAATIVRNTTQKITTGTQDISALVAQIQAAGTGSSKPVTQPNAVQSRVASPDAPQSLVQATADAVAVTKDVTDAWSELTACMIVKAASS